MDIEDYPVARRMVLSDAGLRAAMEGGELEIEPFCEKSLTPNGYDLSAGTVLLPSTGARTLEGSAAVPPKSWFVIGTVERVRLGRGLAAQLWLRTTFARKGILATFGKIDAGFDGNLTVSAFNASETAFEMPLGERFCQMVVERLETPAEKAYAERSGRYQHQRGITLDARDRAPEAGGRGKITADPRVPKAGKIPQSVPDSGDQPCTRHGCDHCCHSTEMPLTNEDIGRLRALGFEQRYFVDEKDGWLQLKNTGDGRCFFLHDGICSVHPCRPEGCRYYPVVFDLDAGRTVLDTECPHRDEYLPARELESRVGRLVERLHRERRDRKRRRVR